MTNTGDFRRYSYSRDTAYALEAFSQTRSSAAPAYKPREKRQVKVRSGSNKKSKKQLISEQRVAVAATVKIMTVAGLVIAMLFAALSSMATKNELNREISSYETRLSVAQSDNIRLNSKLNALVSMSQIDKYAVEELGLTKVQPNQIRYIDVSKFKDERHTAILKQLEKVK